MAASPMDLSFLVTENDKDHMIHDDNRNLLSNLLTRKTLACPALQVSGLINLIPRFHELPILLNWY